MSDWRDVMESRNEADNEADRAGVSAETPDADAIVTALLALRLELRALSTLIDFARRDAR